MSDNRKRKKLAENFPTPQSAGRRGLHTPSPRLTDFYPVTRRNTTFKKRIRFDEDTPAGVSFKSLIGDDIYDDENKENDDSGIFCDGGGGGGGSSSSAKKYSKVSSPRRKFRSRLAFAPKKVIKHLFADLPQEVSFAIFDFLDFSSMSQVALIDITSRNVILNYVKSRKFVERIRNTLEEEEAEENEQIPELTCLKLAQVFKRSTMIMPTLERVSIIHTFLFQMVLAECSRLNQSQAKRWGTFWHRVMRGWEFLECSKAYNNLLCSSKTCGKRLLTSFFNTAPGKNVQEEYRLHVFFRWFLFEYPYTKNEDTGFWLSAILSEFSMYHQAKLLYLIFGPANNTEKAIDWNLMCSTQATPEISDQFFKKLARCFRLLQNYSQVSWTDDTIVSLVEELTTWTESIYKLLGFPDGWLLDNFAYFLLHCEDKVITGILSSRVINGRMDEVCYIFYSMCLCISRTSRNMGLMVRHFQKLMAAIPTEPLRIQFIKALAHQSAVRLPLLYNQHGGANQVAAVEVNAHEQFYGLMLLIVARHFATHHQNLEQ